MALYRFIDGGVINTVTQANIPDDMGNRHWLEYQEWALTNATDPLVPVPGELTAEQQVDSDTANQVMWIVWLEYEAGQRGITIAALLAELKALLP